MSAYFLLALPRLHAELAPLPEDCLTLWPGLPHCPQNAWAPALPWPPALAAACLSDFERACRDGASGAPVHALGAAHAPSDLSAAERQALREMAGMPAQEPEQPLRQTAQQVLILAWLQEKQALDMAELEKKISASRRALNSLLSGRTRVGAPSFMPDDKELPDWKKVLASALAFLPDMPERTAFWISSPSMIQALAELQTEAFSHETETEDLPALPEGCLVQHTTGAALASLCGRSASERLSRELGPAQFERRIVLVYPN